MNRTKVREGIARLVAIVIVILLAAGIGVALGWDIPILSDIADALGMRRTQ